MTAHVPEPIEHLSARALFDTLIDTAPEGFALFDRELRYVHINQALARMNGVPPADHIGRRIDEAVPGVPAEGAAEPMRRVLETGTPAVELEVDGFLPADPHDLRSWLVSYYPVRDSSGGIGWVGALVVDITERKRNEQRAELLADLGAILDEAEGVRERLERLVHALIPRVADMCGVVLRAEDGSVRRAAVAHLDPDLEAALNRAPVTDDRDLDFLPRSPGGSVLVHGVTPGLAARVAPDHPTASSAKAAVFSPLITGGRDIGYLAVAWEQPHRLTDHEVALLEEIARRAAMSIERARLYESERSARERTARLQAATAALATALTAEQVVEAILREGMPAAGATMAAVWQIDADRGILELIGHRGYAGATRTPMARIELDADLPVPECVRTRRPLWLSGACDKAGRYPRSRRVRWAPPPTPSTSCR